MVVVALVIHLWKHEMADFVDPSIAIIEIFILAILSYKYGMIWDNDLHYS